jgi:eukaryotic-like serine/threonine-protein kinase
LDLRTRLQGTIGHRFRVTRELTGGGMSRIFLAEELELEREVVIKVLAPGLVDDGMRTRFRHEVMQTARLQHPTIVPLLEVGSVSDDRGGEVPYFIMPYVRGGSLRSRLHDEHQLSLSLTVRILRNVLDALAHAHALGVVHRDVKPENIFLSGSNAVLADFGIAKALSGPRPHEPVTSPGYSIGSPSYMAPEQIAGDDRTDHRADIYAVGLIAFEMLAGRLPWEGLTPTELLASRARRQMVRLRGLRADVPPALEQLIERCLDWDPSRRPQSAGELARALDAIGITPASTRSYEIQQLVPVWLRPRTRIVVGVAALAVIATGIAGWSSWQRIHRAPLPVRLAVAWPQISQASLATSSTLAQQLYHHLVASLSPVAGLKLVGEVSVPQLHERGLDWETIADSIGVDSMLVMHAMAGTGGSYMLSVELQRRETKRGEIVAGPITVGSLEALPPDSVTTLVRLLSGQVVTRLSLLTTGNNVPVTQILDSWIAWSKGHDAYARRTPEAFREAIGYFERAIMLDPKYAQAYASLATAHATAIFYQYNTGGSPYENASKALRLANTAIELQPTYADGYLAKGYLGTITGAPVEFLEENIGAAKRLNSSNTYSGIWYAALLAARNKFAEALSELQEEALADPESPAKQVALGLYALPEKEYVTTIRVAQKVRLLQPDLPVSSRLELWGRLLLKGPALSECGSVPAGPYLGSRALCLEAINRGRDASTVTDSLFKIVTGAARADSSFDLSLYMAEMTTYYAARREMSAAQQWLRQAFIESPIGIDRRYMRSGLFHPQLIALSDSLRTLAWQRVVRGAEAESAETLRIER